MLYYANSVYYAMYRVVRCLIGGVSLFYVGGAV